MLKRLILGCYIAFRVAAAQAETNPNIIFILTDDQYVGLLGCEGNTLIQTPYIDEMAEEGIFLTNTHVTSAISTPSRISIFLSQYERKHGVNFNSGTSVSDEAWEESYPVVMREGGYYTGYVGKNHAPVGQGGYSSGVMEETFDYWYAGHGHLSFYPKERHEIFKAAENTTQIEIMEEGIQDFMSNEHRMEGAVKFLDARPQDQPFCLSICFNLPHGASTSTMRLEESDDEIYKTLYRDQDIPLPEHYLAKADINNPKLPADLLKAEERQHGYDYVDNPETLLERKTRQMQAVTGIDRLLGNLRELLKEQGLDENTIIIFLSDHGLFMGQYGLGGKALCYETTTHVPCIIYNPMTKKKARGRRLDNLVQSIDIAPTMLDYAGIEIPNSYQGTSIRPLIEGEDQTVRDYLFTENLWSTQFGNPRCEAVQDKEWKYIRYYKNNTFPASLKIEAAKIIGMNVNDMLYAQHDPDIAVYRSYAEGPLEGEEPVYEELFNLKDDPDETTNLVSEAQYEEVLNQLREAWFIALQNARGTEDPKVLRYTKDSQLEGGGAVSHE